MEQKEIFDKLLTKCLFCNSNNIYLFDTDYNKRSISRCKDCGIKFLNPQYTDEFLKNYYSSYIDVSNETNDTDGWKEALYEGHSFYLSLVEKYCKPGNFISVGCGAGIELQTAKDRGWNAEGYDVDPATVKKLSEKLQIKILSGNFIEIDYPQNYYDCVYLHHVLEHPKNPREYLKKIFSILKSNGILFIASPNISSFSNIYKTFMGKFGLKKRRGKHYDTWHHIIYYSPKSLKNILEKCFDFEILHIRNGHHVRPNQSRFKRFIMKNITEIFPWKSTFLIIAKKK